MTIGGVLIGNWFEALRSHILYISVVTPRSRQATGSGFLAYSSTLKMKAISSSKTSVDFHRRFGGTCRRGQRSAYILLLAGYLLGLLFHPEDEGDIFLKSVG
jgi:hypothetical protein